MNWMPHIVSIGIFVAAFLAIDHVVDAHWAVMYGGALVITYVAFALLGSPGVDIDE